jgi:GTPase Era involved in 16S rRNA processing
MIIDNLDIALTNRFYEDHIRCILIGNSGVGKTASLNNLIGKKLFSSRINAIRDTTRTQGAVVNFNNLDYLFVDTPGKNDQHLKYLN